MSISVITLSCRKKGLVLVERALKRQTVTKENFEWIICSPYKPEVEIPHIWIQDSPKPKDLYWQVYRQYNQAIRRAKAPLIVSWQDYTYALPTTLEKFYFHYQTEPKTLVTGVGNKYADETWAVVTWKDPRERDDQGTFYPCFYNDIEWNLCAIPREAIYAVGGFDEGLDKYSSLCGLDVLARLNIIGGYDFKLDQTIKSFSLEHGRLPEWEENSPFNGVWNAKLKSYLEHPILNYLQ